MTPVQNRPKSSKIEILVAEYNRDDTGKGHQRYMQTMFYLFICLCVSTFCIHVLLVSMKQMSSLVVNLCLKFDYFVFMSIYTHTMHVFACLWFAAQRHEMISITAILESVAWRHSEFSVTITCTLSLSDNRHSMACSKSPCAAHDACIARHTLTIFDLWRKKR